MKHGTAHHADGYKEVVLVEMVHQDSREDTVNLEAVIYLMNYDVFNKGKFKLKQIFALS